MIRFSSVDEAKWLVDNLNGNIPEGLTEAVQVRFANAPGAGKGGKSKDWSGDSANGGGSWGGDNGWEQNQKAGKGGGDSWSSNGNGWQAQGKGSADGPSEKIWIGDLPGDMTQ